MFQFSLAEACRSIVLQQSHISTDEAETTDGVMDDSGEDSDSEEDAWDVCAVPKIFTTEGKANCQERDFRTLRHATCSA